MSNQPIDLDAVRERLANVTGKTYWRSLDELADNEAFHSFLDREFPRQAQANDGHMDRRTFVKLMGASLAMAGLSSCQFALRPPSQKIVPYVRLPEEVIPGKALFFATTITQGGYGIGSVAETHEGRPTKLEGNPDHPASLGGTNVFLQAEILQMYDPDRSQTVLEKGQPSSWDAFKQAMAPIMAAKKAAQGAGLRILTETVTSPTLAGQLQRWLSALPQARWVQYEPLGAHNARAGAILAFGEAVDTVYDFTKADVVLSLDSDFLTEGPGQLRYARDFTSRRKVQGERKTLNRLYVAESTLSLTGVNADNRVRVQPIEVERVARSIAQAVGAPGGDGLIQPQDEIATWTAAVARDLQSANGKSIVVAGEYQPPIVHALAHAINQQLGNVGTTVKYIAPVAFNDQDQLAEFRKLVDDMNGGTVDTLIMIGGNPVYNAPADLNFAAALPKVATSVHLDLYVDETSQLCTWHVNQAHELESWGDARAFDGTVSFTQPMIAPLYDGKTPSELVDALDGQARAGFDIVKTFWDGNLAGDFNKSWAEALRSGVVANSAAPAKRVSVNGNLAATAAAEAAGMTLIFRPSQTVLDGSWANSGWLQELPQPLTRISWDNAAIVSPATASQQGLQNGDVVTLTTSSGTLNAPVWILPAQTDNVVTVHLGYGRTAGGQIATSGNNGQPVGFNAYPLRTTANPWFVPGLQVAKTGQSYQLVTMQDTGTMRDRDEYLVRQGTITEYNQNPNFVHEMGENLNISLYPAKVWSGVQWGMTIDLTSCIGCNACVVACVAENNIAVVGKDQISRGRIMHWIRIDRYFEGPDLDNPRLVHQPVPCMQCENAPCESVCPVAATTHSADGLNQMVYNRCVGTKYCSNNCPYKVRRFNFLQYSNETTEVFMLGRNPNVTVRSRGVMEKCTYCVQRIAAVRQDAERRGSPLQDGDVVTACQQACPTEAIMFGNINDPESRVSKLKAEKLNYTMLETVNTRPRTTYLALLRNPNPELGEA